MIERFEFAFERNVLSGFFLSHLEFPGNSFYCYYHRMRQGFGFVKIHPIVQFEIFSK